MYYSGTQDEILVVYLFGFQRVERGAKNLVTKKETETIFTANRQQWHSCKGVGTWRHATVLTCVSLEFLWNCLCEDTSLNAPNANPNASIITIIEDY